MGLFRLKITAKLLSILPLLSEYCHYYSLSDWPPTNAKRVAQPRLALKPTAAAPPGFGEAGPQLILRKLKQEETTARPLLQSVLPALYSYAQIIYGQLKQDKSPALSLPAAAEALLLPQKCPCCCSWPS